jgi:hypothetical protein
MKENYTNFMSATETNLENGPNQSLLISSYHFEKNQPASYTNQM